MLLSDPRKLVKVCFVIKEEWVILNNPDRIQVALRRCESLLELLSKRRNRPCFNRMHISCD